MNKATLNRRIEAFLKNKKESNGGYAPVEPKEVEDLYAIVHALIGLKYETDPDGDLPIHVILTDRTRYERPLALPIRHTHKPVDGLSELELHQDAAEMHAIYAKAATASVQQHLQAVSMLMREAIKAKKPLTLSQVRYVARPPKGATIEAVIKELQKAVDKAYKKEPAPVDFFQRNAWSQRIADAVTKKLELVVKERSCSHSTEGVRMYFDVPQFDCSVRIVSGVPSLAQVIPTVE
jgi:hypothetical protein